MDAHCASSRISIVCRCLDTMHSTAASPGSRPRRSKAINDLVVQAAGALELEDGQKLRVDTTVVQTDIHHPTDNTLLWDVVRVVTRLIGRLAAALGRRRIKGFRDRTRSAR